MDRRRNDLDDARLQNRQVEARSRRGGSSFRKTGIAAQHPHSLRAGSDGETLSPHRKKPALAGRK
jgi:hypothetical protein